MYDDTNLAVEKINTYVNSNPPAYGLNVTERLFWEAYVMIQDCSRPSGTEWDIGRGSEVSVVARFCEVLYACAYHVYFLLHKTGELHGNESKDNALCNKAWRRPPGGLSDE